MWRSVVIVSLAVAGCAPEPTCDAPRTSPLPIGVSCYSDRNVPIAEASGGPVTFWIPVCGDEVPLEVDVIDSEAEPGDPVQYRCTAGVTSDWEEMGPRVVYERVNPRCRSELVRTPTFEDPDPERRTVIECPDGSQARCAPVVCPWPPAE